MFIKHCAKHISQHNTKFSQHQINFIFNFHFSGKTSFSKGNMSLRLHRIQKVYLRETKTTDVTD